MASSYVNNLRLEEIGTGEASGTWGTKTNTNLSLIGKALGAAYRTALRDWPSTSEFPDTKPTLGS